MKREGYQILQNTDLAYSFVSRGKVADLLKVVIFQLTDDGAYNMALLDYDEIQDSFSDTSRSDNGDMPMVLATVVKIMLHFFEKDSSRIVYIEANTPLKNKLYHRILKNNLFEIGLYFEILGCIDNKKELFDTSKLYESFYISKIITS